MRDILKTIHFSEPGTTQTTREEATYMYFLDLLHECEGKHNVKFFWHALLKYLCSLCSDAEDLEVTFSQLLSFFTGSEYPPPFGFH